MIRNFLTSVAVVAMVAGFAAAGDLKSGPQEGQKVPGPFHPFNVTGDDAGKKQCLYCKNGENPVAVVFARNPEDAEVQKLIAALDAATVKNSKAEMGSYVVFLVEDEKKQESTVKEIANKNGLKKIVLSIDSPQGPSKYNISKDADVTVLLYTERVVKANYSFAKGKLDDKAIDAVVADVAKIVPAK